MTGAPPLFGTLPTHSDLTSVPSRPVGRRGFDLGSGLGLGFKQARSEATNNNFYKKHM